MTIRPPGEPRSALSGREPWIDLARGSTVLLVVLFHAQTVLASSGLTGPGWTTAMAALSTLRMPTFFLISGLFARKSLTAQSSTFRVHKVWPFLWMYLLWSAMYIIVLEVTGLTSGNPAFLHDAQQWIDDTLMANTVLWYLVALPAFFLAARLLHRTSARIQIAGAAIVSSVFSSGIVHTGQWGVDHMAACFVYFLAGCYFGTTIRAAAVRAGWWTATILSLSWVGLSVGIYALHWPNFGQVVLPLLAVPSVLTLAPQLARQAWTHPLIWLGRNTLPVYVMHLAPLSLIALAVRRTHIVTAGSGLAAGLPALMAAAATMITLGVRPLLVRWAPWSLVLPSRIAGHDVQPEKH